MDERLHKLIDAIFDSHADTDVGCDVCDQHLHRLWDLVMAGAELRQLLPAIEAHLACCPECREEYDAFMAIMRAEQAGLLRYSTLPPDGAAATAP